MILMNVILAIVEFKKTSMNDFEFLVFEMRALQIKYFKSRDRDVLIKSKEAEKKVDAHLSNINNPGLFP